VKGDTEAKDNPRTTLPRRIWRSAFPGPGIPRTDRDRARVTLNTALLHLRPVRLPTATLRWTHTLGLGGSSLVLFTLLVASGALMLLLYQPAAGAAHESVTYLEEQVLFGPLVRGVHFWSANLLILVMLAHAARVFLTGGYHGPRQFNWVIGCGLLLLVLAASFTGYLLPWDQLSYWAVTISTGMLQYVPGVGPALAGVLRGGPELGTDTLVIFYALHTTVVPTCLVVLMAFHFWRVRKAGGVVVPPPRVDDAEHRPDRVLFLPHLLGREAAQAAVLLALVLWLASLFGAPLGPPANPGMSPNPAKAPWYFTGFQELLVHFHPLLAVLVIPLAGLLAALLLPYLTADDEPAGAWFLSARGRRLAGIAAASAATLTPFLVALDEVLGAGGADAPGWLLGGLVPLAVLVAGVWSGVRFARTRLGATTNEAVQALVVLLAVAFAVLTLIGVHFRGAAWP
jgi:quinol-cytochrome oxidoreductase complex cytochrome b subunit